MKIPINKTVTEYREVPKYFKNALNGYFKIIEGDKCYFQIYDLPFDAGIYSFPQIKIWGIATIGLEASRGIEPISEAEFKAVFMKVSEELENLMK